MTFNLSRPRHPNNGKKATRWFPLVQNAEVGLGSKPDIEWSVKLPKCKYNEILSLEFKILMYVF